MRCHTLSRSWCVVNVKLKSEDFCCIFQSKLNEYLQLIDFDTNGSRCDVTPFFASYDTFSALVNDLVQRFASESFDLVAGIDGIRIQKGFVPIRKGLPVKTDNRICGLHRAAKVT
jgi:hypothetical protein